MGVVWISCCYTAAAYVERFVFTPEVANIDGLFCNLAQGLPWVRGCLERNSKWMPVGYLGNTGMHICIRSGFCKHQVINLNLDMLVGVGNDIIENENRVTETSTKSSKNKLFN
jgi:hypothetical protein